MVISEVGQERDDLFMVIITEADIGRIKNWRWLRSRDHENTNAIDAAI